MKIHDFLTPGLTVLLYLPACSGAAVAADTESMSDSSSSSSSSTTADPGSSDASSSGGPGMCAVEPGDDQCAVCIKGQCCEQTKACEASEDCSCLLSCVLGGVVQLCDLCAAHPMQVPEFGALFECMGQSCTDQCS